MEARVKGMKARNMQQLLASFPDHHPNPVVCIDGEGRLLYCNQASRELLPFWNCHNGNRLPHEVAAAVRKGHDHVVEFTVADRTYAFTVVPVEEFEACFLCGRDITESKMATERLQQLSQVIEKSTNIVFVVDYDGKIEYVNPMFERVTGYTLDEVRGKSPRILATGYTSAEEYARMWDIIKSGKTWRGVLRNRKKDDSCYWANGLISPITDTTGKITHFMAIQEDITQKLEAENKVRYYSERDRVTGLVNRGRFGELLEERFRDVEKYGSDGALLYLNLDGFRLVNHSHGYHAGDQLLHEVGDLLHKKAEELNLVYSGQREVLLGHLGADEFALWLTRCNEHEAVTTAESLRVSFEQHSFLKGLLQMTISIGIALFPKHGQTMMELLKKSNAAAVVAKEQGKNSYMLFHEETTALEEASLVLEQRQRILSGLQQGLFVPWYQPILDLRTGAIHHYEALARMVTTEGVVLQPNEFIPTAERYGLIADIDQTIGEQTMRLQARLAEQGIARSFSMNLSARNLGDGDMFRNLLTALETTQAIPGHLVLEVTETAAIRNLEGINWFVKALKELGCRIALDDFGVGFTSYIHLVKLEVDFLKIDGSFVRHLPTSEQDRVLVKTISNMAKTLGIQTVAEFVHSKEVLDIVKELGVDHAQGYYIGRPEPRPQFSRETPVLP